MPPYVEETNTRFFKAKPIDSDSDASRDREDEYKLTIVWKNVAVMAYLHLAGLYGAYLAVTSANVNTILAGFLMYWMGGLGVTAGAHRLWAHKTYKATWLLRTLLMIFNCMACQNDIYEWSRDHRLHHKYSETHADPHNANRGFFFSHIGWLLCKKHPQVFKKGATMDFSDILEDPIVRFQRRHYVLLCVIFCFVIPTAIPMILWKETFWNSFFVAGMLRYAFLLNMTWLVNSAAHMWGNRPYDNNISAAENMLVIVGSFGEGYHNYHHTFPWDYATSEIGWTINGSKFFIDVCSWLGFAYDLKRADPDVVLSRRKRTGDLRVELRANKDQHDS